MTALKKTQTYEADQDQLSLFAYAGADENGYIKELKMAKQPQCDLALARLARAGLPALRSDLELNVARYMRGSARGAMALRSHVVGIYSSAVGILGIIQSDLHLPEMRDALVYEMREFGFVVGVVSPLVGLSFGELTLNRELESAYAADVYAYMCAAELLARVVAYALDGKPLDDLLE